MTTRKRAEPVWPKQRPSDLTPAALAYLAGRGISEATARRNGVGVERRSVGGRDVEYLEPVGDTGSG
jgi:hypothetical protein